MNTSGIWCSMTSKNEATCICSQKPAKPDELVSKVAAVMMSFLPGNKWSCFHTQLVAATQTRSPNARSLVRAQTFELWFLIMIIAVRWVHAINSLACTCPSKVNRKASSRAPRYDISEYARVLSQHTTAIRTRRTGNSHCKCKSPCSPRTARWLE